MFFNCILKTTSILNLKFLFKKKQKEPEKFAKPLEDIHAKEEEGTVKFNCVFCKSHGKLRWYIGKFEIFFFLNY